ncbi:hypothetical protein BDV93DRAFT_564279 [Ceratobasidium sp. AG-I]|nr:hypothetical protein BDV93DRAFT_564279 [Ceratobasidium sp. AG-I]
MKNLTCINSLYPELLALIFSLVVHKTISIPTVLTDNVFETYLMDFSFTEITEKQTLRRAVVLSGVCGSWRSVVLHTSSFWTCTSIALSNRNIQRSLDRLPIWLERARTTPLDIYLTTHAYRDTSISKTMLDQVVSRLSLGSKQIGTLHLSLLSIAYLNTLLKTWFSNGVSATLTRLDVDVGDATDELSTLQDWISQCQELQVLRLDVGTLCSDHFPAMPKLVNLKLFSDKVPITMTQLANIFHACPNLRQLKLYDLYLEDSTSGDLIPAHFQHLELLSLQFLDVTRVFPLLSSKSNSLSLSIFPDMENNLMGDVVNHIINFSRHSAITALDLYAEDIESNDFCRLISCLPHLRTISLKDCYLDDLMASALRGADEPNRAEDAGPSTYPTLHTIWLTDSAVDNENTMRSLVSPRRLKQLKLENCSLESSGTILEAKELCEYLRGAVSDLSIVNNDMNSREPAFFP